MKAVLFISLVFLSLSAFSSEVKTVNLAKVKTWKEAQDLCAQHEPKGKWALGIAREMVEGNQRSADYGDSFKKEDLEIRLSWATTDNSEEWNKNFFEKSPFLVTLNEGTHGFNTAEQINGRYDRLIPEMKAELKELEDIPDKDKTEDNRRQITVIKQAIEVYDAVHESIKDGVTTTCFYYGEEKE